MARYNNTIDTDADAVFKLAKRLRLIADSFEQQAQLLEKAGLPFVSVTHWKSAKAGASALAAFAGALQDAIVETELTDALGEVAKKPSVAQSQADALARAEQLKPTKRGKPKS